MSILTFILYATIILAFFPTGLCFYYYVKTKVKEYFYVGMSFIFGIISVYTSISPPDPPILWVDQLESICYISIYLFFFLYAIRINADLSQKIVFFGFIWYILMFFMVLLYELTAVGNEMEVIYIQMVKNSDSPTIVGTFHINDMIVVGKGFEFVFDLFRMFVFGIILYSYLTTHLPLKNANTINLWRIWIIAVSVHLIGSLQLMGNSLGIWEIHREVIDFTTFFTLILVAYIAVWHPEAFLITHTQLIRAYSLYESVKK